MKKSFFALVILSISLGAMADMPQDGIPRVDTRDLIVPPATVADEQHAWNNVYATDKAFKVELKCDGQKDTTLQPSCERRHHAMVTGAPTYRYGVNMDGMPIEATRATKLPDGTVLLE